MRASFIAVLVILSMSLQLSCGQIRPGQYVPGGAPPIGRRKDSQLLENIPSLHFVDGYYTQAKR
jgi:hypothetical protein